MSESAFPIMPPCTDNGEMPAGYPYAESGMTLRDYFAARAMEAFITSGWTDRVREEDCKNVSMWSYKMADAMMKHRKDNLDPLESE